ncbi:hypothetical protein PSEUBRA_003985 [Kalmanozyma brasiliensis GHG001]|nr:uncharacterized protein PSEUBRA_003985 [Kalmanozyma brasiliensis GHG001]EST06120.2 hypothetical protein PSEUBRA_003985 [Kalmanozyma brasiliensis GHG001]
MALSGVSAGWHTEQPPEYTLDRWCNTEDEQGSRACFTTDVDVSHPNPASDFEGFLSADGKKSVIWRAKQSALLQTDDYIINVSFNDQGVSHCAAADIQTLTGNTVDNGNFCNASSRWLHLPAKQ